MPPRERRTRTSRAGKPDLTVVDSSAEAAAPAKPEQPLTITEAADAGNRIEELRATRRRLARAMDDPKTPARDLSPLARNLLAIGKEIEALELLHKDESSVVAGTEDEAWDGTGY
ncbi:hypothetical protein [Nocardia sp. No.11]|uniref:hypothetical protein n=1 Tax=Nocardia sp. No.11 TaxID=3128861 RepID=UPI00319EA4C6